LYHVALDHVDYIRVQLVEKQRQKRLTDNVVKAATFHESVETYKVHSKHVYQPQYSAMYFVW